MNYTQVKTALPALTDDQSYSIQSMDSTCSRSSHIQYIYPHHIFPFPPMFCNFIYEEIFLIFFKSLDLDTYRYFMILLFSLYYFLPQVSLCVKHLNKPIGSSKYIPRFFPRSMNRLQITNCESESLSPKSKGCRLQHVKGRDLCRNDSYHNSE